MANPIQWIKDHREGILITIGLLVVIIAVIIVLMPLYRHMGSDFVSGWSRLLGGKPSSPVISVQTGPPITGSVPGTAAPTAGFQGMVNPLVAAKKRLMANTKLKQ